MPDLDQGIVLSFMRTALRGFPALQDHSSYALMSNTLEKMSAAGVIDTGHDSHSALNRMFERPQGMLYQHVAIWLLGAYQQLLSHGYIVPMPSAGGFHPERFLVTPDGAQWAAGLEMIPEDLKGYLNTLKKFVPAIDGVVFEYVREALATYGHRMFFSSAVMIGAASERVIYLLMDFLLKAVSDPQEKQRIQNAMERRALPPMFKCLLDNIAHAKKVGMPYPTHEQAEYHLFSLQDAIRVQRNDAVHPQIRQISPELVRLTLSAFPYACKKAYDLIRWLNSNTI